MRLQIASDLHLETRPKQTFETMLEPGASCLALLGDIAPLENTNLLSFLEWCSERWETIFYIPGKLECFSLTTTYSNAETVDRAIQKLIDICSSFKNIHVLYRDTFYTDDGLIVLGCPFWSFDPGQPKYIKELHRKDLSWIQSMTKKYTNPFLVLSHYGPVSWVQYENEIIDPTSAPVFAETELLLRDPITTWVFGHCHTYVEYSKVWNTAGGLARSVLLVCNGLGRKRVPGFEFNAGPISDYRAKAVLRIDPMKYLESV